jgi:hypothetical protein
MTISGPDDDRARDRADDLLPEERRAGSDDPQAQAAAVLADSDERAAQRDGDDVAPEHRSSEDTVEP